MPILEVLLQTKSEIEAFSAQAGLKIIHALLEHEIDERCGQHGKQSAYRHGQQPGYIVFAGRKVARGDQSLGRAQPGGRPGRNVERHASGIGGEAGAQPALDEFNLLAHRVVDAPGQALAQRQEG